MTKANTSAFSYPIMLKLQGKKCVIIGGGVVAARKLATLGQAGASITIIAPYFTPELKAAAQKYSCTLCAENYKPEDITDAFLVIAATDSFAINREITNAAPCLCNNITEPELSNFTVPSSFNIDNIKVTIATGGIPGYTRLLKHYLKSKLKPCFGEFNTFLLEERQHVKATASTPAERTVFWRQVLNENLLHLLEDENIEEAKEHIHHAVDSFRAQSQNSAR